MASRDLESDAEYYEEPEEEDYVIFDARGGGYGVSIVWGMFLGTFATREEAEEAIRDDAVDFYPNVWVQSDHGNNHLIEDFKWR